MLSFFVFILYRYVYRKEFETIWHQLRTEHTDEQIFVGWRPYSNVSSKYNHILFNNTGCHTCTIDRLTPLVCSIQSLRVPYSAPWSVLLSFCAIQLFNGSLARLHIFWVLAKVWWECWFLHIFSDCVLFHSEWQFCWIEWYCFVIENIFAFSFRLFIKNYCLVLATTFMVEKKKKQQPCDLILV